MAKLLSHSQTTVVDHAKIKQLEFKNRAENFRRRWYQFTRNRLSIVGLGIVVIITWMAIFAPLVAPFPEQAGPYTDFARAGEPPSREHPFGLDLIGRDVLSRIIFSLRPALLMGIVVLSIVVPFGVFLGLIAGYAHGTWVETIVMRITDIFIAVPALVLALAIASVLTPSLSNSMIAVTVMWWPWYTRLVFGLSSSLSNEDFVRSAELMGASKAYIIIKEILPNCWGPITTKMSLDMGWVILIGAALSFVGLGEQPPAPALGTMVSEGAKLLPDMWWIAVFPALAIVVVVLGFNLFGDGLHDALSAEKS